MVQTKTAIVMFTAIAGAMFSCGGSTKSAPVERYAVPIAGSAVVGADSARVTIVYAVDFTCGYCARMRATLETLEREYGDDMRVVYKHYALDPASKIAAAAACAADRQSRFSDMAASLWDAGSSDASPTAEWMDALAEKLDLNVEQFRSDAGGPACQSVLAIDHLNLIDFGVDGAPFVFINGRRLRGLHPIDHYRRVIDEELELAEGMLRVGVSPDEYYRTVVLTPGRKPAPVPDSPTNDPA